MKIKICGFTLVELVFVLLTLALMVAAAIPSLNQMLDENQRAQSTNQMAAVLYFARSSAVIEQSVVTVCAGINKCAGIDTWNDDLIVFLDLNANGTIDSGDTILRVEKQASGHAWAWSSRRQNGFLQFDPNGTTRAHNGTFTLCQENQPVHQIVLSLSGRIRNQSPSERASC